MACLNFIHAVLCHVSIRIIIVTGSLQLFRKRSLNNHNNDKSNIPWNTSLKSDLPEILFSYKLYISLHTLFCKLGVSRIHTFRYQVILFFFLFLLKRLPETLFQFSPWLMLLVKSFCKIHELLPCPNLFLGYIQIWFKRSIKVQVIMLSTFYTTVDHRALHGLSAS